MNNTSPENIDRLKEPKPRVLIDVESPSYKAGFHKRLSFKLARTGVIIAFILGVGISTAEVYLDYSRRQIEFVAEVDRVLKVSAPAAERAVHLLDEELAREVVQGLMEYDFIINAQVDDDSSMILAQEVQSQVDSSTRWISRVIMEDIREFSISLTSVNSDDLAPGKLTIDIDMDRAFAAFYVRSSFLLFAGMVLPLILVFLYLAVFYVLLTQPLTKLANSFSQIDPDNPGRLRLSIDKTHAEDELGMLAKAGNDFLEITEHHFRQRETAEQKLKEARDELERRVEVRTKELRREITERRSAEQALQELNASLEQKVELRTHDLNKAKETAEFASRSKSQFLANMSHELRTPLNAIIGFSLVMKDQMMGGLENEKYLEYSADIHDSSNHLLRVISDILDISKIEAGELSLDEQVINMPEAVESCRLLLADSIRQKKLQLNTSYLEFLPKLRGDSTRVKQIIINFLSNATKFTPDGGQIFVSCTLDDDGRFVLRVNDSGIGIAEEDISKVLEPFGQVDDIMTRTHEGTGLGLSLCVNLIDQHNGTMTLESKLGMGTTVTAIFPAWRVMHAADEILLET